MWPVRVQAAGKVGVAAGYSNRVTLPPERQVTVLYQKLKTK